MSTPPDKNYLSLSGDDAGNIWKNGMILFEASVPGIRTVNLGDVVPDSLTYSDTLKLSGVRRLEVLVDRLVGSIEDCVDINHSHDATVRIKECCPTGLFISTIKGGSTNIALVIDVLRGTGTETGVDLGNFTEFTNDKTTGVTIKINNSTVIPEVRVINAAMPTTIGIMTILEPWWSYWPFWQIYCFARNHNWVK